MNIVVNLLSDQTIPNLQFLKKFYKDGDHILMISTSKMEEKGVGNWILSALDHKTIHDSQIITKVVKEFDPQDISTKLNELDFNDYDDIFVNITGGTKIMSLSAYDFFKEKRAQIYYITGNNDEVLELFPERNNVNIKLSEPVTLLEYLKAYGFNKEITSVSGRTEEYTLYFFDWFLW